MSTLADDIMHYYSETFKNEKMVESIRDAERYVVTQPVLNMASEITGYPWTFHEGPDRWLEWRDGRVPVGMLISYHAETPVDRPIHSIAVFHGQKRLGNIWMAAQFVQNDDGSFWSMEDDPELNEAETRILRTAAAVLEMVQNPRIVLVRERHHDEALQRARRKRGRSPLLDCHEILVHVNRRVYEGSNDEEEPTNRKCLHPVRPFVRTQFGRPVMVAGHWRGDPRLGVRVPDHYKVVP